MQRRIEVLRKLERQYMREWAARLGLHPLGGMLLHLTATRGPMRQEELSVWTGVDKGRIARMLAQLEADGLVARQVRADCRREKIVTLTPQGEERTRQVHQIMADWNEICYRGFTQEEREQYSAYLNRIIDNALLHRMEEEKDG